MLFFPEKAQTHPIRTTQSMINPSSTTDITISTMPVLLSNPVLDLNVTAVNKQITRLLSRVAALPGGEAAVAYDVSQVLKINKTGHTIKELYNCQSCTYVGGLLFLGSNLYVIHDNGTIVKIQPYTGYLLNVYHISDVSSVNHYGSLWTDPSKIPNTDILLLPGSNEVFSYNLTSKHKQVHLTGLSSAVSVSYSLSDNSTLYVVCEVSTDRISIYNSSWDLESSFGGMGRGDGYLRTPYAAIMSPNNTIFVSDFLNHRISVFTTDGAFLYHLLTQSDGILYPSAVSYYKPYLWVVNNEKLYRYKLFK